MDPTLFLLWSRGMTMTKKTNMYPNKNHNSYHGTFLGKGMTPTVKFR